MLISERIVLLLSIYMAFIYGLLYLFLTAYPLVFQGVHGMNLGVGGLPFFGMITGQLLAGALIFIRQPGYQKKLAANNNIPIPEWRLPEVIAGGICFSLGIFWFGWSGYKSDVHWIVPTLAGVLIGFGLLSIFLQALNYLVDAYLMVSCSTCFMLLVKFSDFVSSLPPPLLQQTPSFEVFAVLHSLFSHVKCSKAWVSNGHLLYLAALLRFLYLFQYGFTLGELRLGRRVHLHRHSQSRPSLRRAMEIKLKEGHTRST
jgi:hypothetical protein